MNRPISADTDARISLTGSAFSTLFPARFDAREALDAPATLTLHAHGGLPPPAPSGMTGNHATLSLAWGESPRLIDAVCTRAAQLPSTIDASHFTLELRSWLWLLTLSRNNRIFQGKNAQEIIQAVFGGTV